MDRSINFCLLSIKTPLFVDSADEKTRGKQKDSLAKPQMIAPSRFTSGGLRNSNLKHRITKRLKVHGVLSGLFHSSVGYMKIFLELCGKLNFCAVG